MPELRHLRYFVVVAEELNFSRAATRLHMAQPPLSVAIRQLEQELGTDLFARTSREVKLTQAGDVFLDGARRTLAEADRAVDAAKRAAAGELGQLRLGFSWSARFETLPALGRAFSASHPDVELLTQEMWNAQMITALRSGTIDAAISLCPELESGIESEPVRNELVVVCAASETPAAAGSVALATLADRTFLLFPHELAPRLYDTLVGFCRRAGFEPEVRSESFHTSWDPTSSPRARSSRWPRAPSPAGSAKGSRRCRSLSPGASWRHVWSGEPTTPRRRWRASAPLPRRSTKVSEWSRTRRSSRRSTASSRRATAGSS